MSISTKHPAVRWLAPIAVLVVVAGAALIGHAVASGVGAASLPEVTAAQLLADIEQADITGVSGTVVESADLGLPSLPGLDTSDSGLLGMVTGTHTLRIWYGGPTKQRVALLDSLGESDIIRNGTDLWTWDSSDNSATHHTVPADGKGGLTGGLTGGSTPSLATVDPQQAAAAALAMIGPSTTVTVDNTAVVAGRAAYELVLAPKGSGSLISAVRIAVDGSTYVPLRVQIDSASTHATAFSVGFTSVDFGKPDDAEFTFTPPPGATVNQSDTAASGVLNGLPHVTAPTVVGKAWMSVMVADQAEQSAGSPNRQPKPGSGPVMTCATVTGPATAPAATSTPAPTTSAPLSGGVRKECSSGATGGDGLGELTAIQQALPKVSGSWGSGRLLAGTLFTVVITDDHRIAVGAVTPDVVYAALGHQ